MSKQEKWGLVITIYFMVAGLENIDNILMFIAFMILAGISMVFFLHGSDKEGE